MSYQNRVSKVCTKTRKIALNKLL